MTIEEAVTAHVEWKIRLRSAIADRRGIDENLSCDACCDLGVWLHGYALVKYGDLDAYGECVEAHRRFHVEAGRVAALINAGDYAGADAALAFGAAFMDASSETVAALHRLRKAL